MNSGDRARPEPYRLLLAELLSNVLRRPGMYFVELRDLQMMIHGHQVAADQAALSSGQQPFNQALADWLYERTRIGGSLGWAHQLEEVGRRANKPAAELFLELLPEFFMQWAGFPLQKAAPDPAIDASELRVSGPEVFAHLLKNWALQDCIVNELDLTSLEGTLHVRLRCVPQWPEKRKYGFVELMFGDVEVFDLSWHADSRGFLAVDSYIAGIFDDRAYLSLDPYDFTVQKPDERDAQVIVARSVTARFGS